MIIRTGLILKKKSPAFRKEIYGYFSVMKLRMSKITLHIQKLPERFGRESEES